MTGLAIHAASQSLFISRPKAYKHRDRIPARLHLSPGGSQPEAIAQLNDGLADHTRLQTLLGVTGSGKTFTMANVIAAANKPTLVIAHNKTLAAQLYQEFCDFFPKNRVEYFVSYYDYYQPESYIPAKDQYIEKDSAINPKIEMLRLSATASLSCRRDVIVVASVSCIFGLGNPENFRNLGFDLSVGQKITRNDIMSRLLDIQFERNDIDLRPGRFRVKGDTIDIVPGTITTSSGSNSSETRSSVSLRSTRITGAKKEAMKYFYVYPARHFVTTGECTESGHCHHKGRTRRDASHARTRRSAPAPGSGQTSTSK